MPEQLSTQPDEQVRNLLVTDWVPANTQSYDPTLDPASDPNALPITFGNYVSDLPDPQVSLAVPQGEFNADGSTHWSGAQGDGSGLNQWREGFVLVQCWASAGTDYNGVSARVVTKLLSDEVERVIGAYQHGVDELQLLAPHWDGRFPDPDVGETMWQSQVRVSYQWERTP